MKLKIFCRSSFFFLPVRAKDLSAPLIYIYIHYGIVICIYILLYVQPEDGFLRAETFRCKILRTIINKVLLDYLAYHFI